MSVASTVLVLVPALGLLADDPTLSDWVRRRIALQRGPAAVLDGGAVWRERPDNVPGPMVDFVPPTSLSPLVKEVRAGVVNISTRNQGSSRSLGSGFIISVDGLVVTNNHVVDRAQEVVVRTHDGRSVPAQVLGRDASTDLAILRMTRAENVRPVFLGDSDALEVGDWVVAIGNPFGLDTSVTHGLISARERVLGIGPYDDFIQTNALVNPGNSGGPLFDMDGNVVGVTTAVMSQGQGIGFAVPINLVKDLLPNLLENGRAERGWLGVSVTEVGVDERRATVVADVFENSPAWAAGIMARDRVVGIAGRPVQRYQQILRRIALLGPGATVKLDLERDGQPLSVTVTLVERPTADGIRPVASVRDDTLGASLKPVANPPGVLVESVLPASAARAAGLTAGDVIVEVNREPITSVDALRLALKGEQPDDGALVRVFRDGGLLYLTVRSSP